MDSNPSDSRRDDRTQTGPSSRQRVLLAFRSASLACVLVGFLGALASGTVPVDPDSPFSFLFGLGIVGAVVTIYAGILGQQ